MLVAVARVELVRISNHPAQFRRQEEEQLQHMVAMTNARDLDAAVPISTKVTSGGQSQATALLMHRSQDAEVTEEQKRAAVASGIVSRPIARGVGVRPKTYAMPTVRYSRARAGAEHHHDDNKR